jgi:hypothetical protein
MNIKACTLSILLFAVSLVYSQQPPVSHVAIDTNSSVAVKKTIVRSYKKYAVSYIEDSGKHFYTITESHDVQNPASNMTIKKVEIDSRYDVTDFKVIDNYIYCCGNLPNNYAFVGFANIEELLLNNNFDFYVYDNFCDVYDYDHYVEKLSKLEVYKVEDGFRVVAIGKSIDRFFKIRSCLLEIVISSLGNTNITYKVGESPLDVETINSLVVTDNYVATVGTLYENSTAIRRFDKNSIFADTTNIKRVYTYPTNEEQISLLISEDRNNILATPIINDTIAVVSYWYHAPMTNLGSDLQGVLFRVYDINTPTAPTMVTSLTLNHYNYIGNWNLNEIQYNSILKAFTLLQYTNISPNSLGSLFSVIKFNNNPIVQSEYYSNIELNSLDNIRGTRYCLLSGYDILGAYAMIAAKIDNYTSTNTCGTYINGTTASKTIYTSKIESEEMVTFGDNKSFTKVGSISINTYPINEQCTKY